MAVLLMMRKYAPPMVGGAWGGVYRWGGCGCRGEGVRNEVESGVGVGVRREVGRVRGEGAVEESGCKEMLQRGEGL